MRNVLSPQGDWRVAGWIADHDLGCSIVPLRGLTLGTRNLHRDNLIT
jgi:hypothetical protein